MSAVTQFDSVSCATIMQCESCGNLATYHVTAVGADGDSVQRSLCELHAREAGFPVASTNGTSTSVVTKMKLLADFLRTNRRMPTSDEMMAIGGAVGSPCDDTDEDIDACISYLDAFVDFVHENGRFPTEDELHDPF